MPSGKLFWFAAALTILFMFLYMFGYGSIEIVITLIIVDMVMLKLLHEQLGKDLGSQLMGEFNTRFGGVVSDLTNFMKSHSNPGNPGTANEVTFGGIEKTLAQHRDELRKEFNDSIDRMAKKAIEIENKLNSAIKNFSSAIGAFDDRIRSLETVEADSTPMQTNSDDATGKKEIKDEGNYMELRF